MRHSGVLLRPGVLIAFLCVGSLAANADGGLLCNAKDGVFNTDRRFWFSVPDGDRLVLTVDGAVQYRGGGPESVLLGADEGTERTHKVVASRLAAPPSTEVIESRSYQVLIDKKAPTAPVPIAVPTPSGWKLSFHQEEGSVLGVALDADGYVQWYDDFGQSREISAASISGYAWSSDRSGNTSTPIPFSFSPFSIDIANPAPGTWANRQTLAIESRGTESIRWSIGGADPAGPEGHDYSGPVRIDASGEVHLRIDARAPDGRQIQKELTYTAQGRNDVPGLGTAEAAFKTGTRSVTIPQGYVWDISDTRSEQEPPSGAGVRPQFPGGVETRLRAVAGVDRWVAIVASPEKGDTEVPYRYVFCLCTSDVSGMSQSGSQSLSVEPGSVAVDDDSPSFPFRTYQSGAARVLVPTSARDSVRYRVISAEEAGPWLDTSGPFVIPAQACSVEWVKDGNPGFDGSYTIQTHPFPSSLPKPIGGALAVSVNDVSPSMADELLPLGGGSTDLGERPHPATVSLTVPDGQQFPRYSLALSSDHGRPALVSPVEESDPPRIHRLDLDACDGEDLTWTIALGAEGDPERSVLYVRIDRRAPMPPTLEVPDEGAVLPDAVSVSAVSDEGRSRIEVTARREDGISRHFEKWADEGPLSLGGEQDGLVTYTVRGWTIDDAGNKSAPVSRSFVVDAFTVYVSNLGALQKKLVPAGTRAAPFVDLAEAVAFASRTGRSRVAVAGSASFDKGVSVGEGLSIQGGYDGKWELTGIPSVVEVGSDAGFTVSGCTLDLSSLRFESPSSRGQSFMQGRDCTLNLTRVEHRTVAGSNKVVASGMELSPVPVASPPALMRVSDGSILSLSECTLYASGAPALDISDSKGSLGSTYLVSSGSMANVVRAVDSTLLFSVSRVESEGLGDRAILLDVKGGSLRLESSVVYATGGRSALGLSGKDTKLVVKETMFKSQAKSFAQALDLRGGSLLWDGGGATAEASDAACISLSSLSGAELSGAAFSVRASAIARAIQADATPLSLDSCRLSSSSPASSAEALSGRSIGAWRILGTGFFGFNLILAPQYGWADMDRFNAIFATPAAPNRAALR